MADAPWSLEEKEEAMELMNIAIVTLSYAWSLALLACLALSLVLGCRAAWFAVTTSRTAGECELDRMRARVAIVRGDWRVRRSRWMPLLGRGTRRFTLRTARFSPRAVDMSGEARDLHCA